jgi:hypothetical protein
MLDMLEAVELYQLKLGQGGKAKRKNKEQRAKEDRKMLSSSVPLRLCVKLFL